MTYVMEAINHPLIHHQQQEQEATMSTTLSAETEGSSGSGVSRMKEESEQQSQSHVANDDYDQHEDGDEEVEEATWPPDELPTPFKVERETQSAEWSSHFMHSHSTFHARAIHRAVDGRGLRGSHLRPHIYWKLYLGALDRRDMGKWAEQVREQRNSYEKLLRKYDLTAVKASKPPGVLDDDLMDDVSDSSPIGREDSTIDLRVHNPLSTQPNNSWNSVLADQEMANQIRHDLNRTHQDVELFTHSLVQKMMFNVLMVWSKECSNDKDGRYRQGMNELLAVMVMTVLTDAQWRDETEWKEADGKAATKAAAAASTDGSTAPSSSSSSPASGSSNDSHSGLLPLLLDRAYVEHDLYELFRRLMDRMAPFYIKVETHPSKAGVGAGAAAAAHGRVNNRRIGNGDASSMPDTPIVSKVHEIHHSLLSTLDPKLYAHLQSMDVSPNLYLLRWVRLMCAREFHMQDVLCMWDVCFATDQNAKDDDNASSSNSNDQSDSSQSKEDADNSIETLGRERSLATGGSMAAPTSPLSSTSTYGFVLLDYICLAMLLYVRSALLQGDQTYCLRRLMRYPPVEEIRVIISRALHFHSSWKAICADPSLVASHLHAATDEQMARELGGSGGSGAGHASGSGSGSAALGTGWEGPWQRISEGMEADAPLESPDAPHSHHGHHPSQSNPKPRGKRSGKGGASSAKALFAEGFSTLKHFVKGTIAKAGESNHGKSSRSSHHNAHAHNNNASAPFPAPKKNLYQNLPPGGRGLPSTTGVSHFLSPNSPSSSSSSSNPSPPAPTSSVSPPSPAVHDELVLLRRDLAAAQKQNKILKDSLATLAQQLKESDEMKKYMGGLMAHTIADLEKEYDRVTYGSDEEDANASKQSKKEETAADKDTPIEVNGNEASSSDKPTEPSSAESAQTESASAVATCAASATPASSSTPRAFNDDILVRGLAELKKIRDVLLGRLDLQDLIDSYQLNADGDMEKEDVKCDTEAGSGSTADENGATTLPGKPLPRGQILAALSASHARQQAAAKANGGSTSSSSPFPYTQLLADQAASAKASERKPLFEEEARPRDKVRDLFTLEEEDALPGVYDKVHTAASPPSMADNNGESGTKSNGASTATTTTSPVSSVPSSASTVMATDPLHNSNVKPSSVGASASSASAAQSASSAIVRPATTVAAPSSSPVPARSHAKVNSDLLNNLLGGSSPPASASSKAASSRSLFDSTPPDSPTFGAAAARAGTGVSPSLFALEQEDDDILLPSAHKFKAPPRTVPPPSAAPTVAAKPAAAKSKAAKASPLSGDPLFSPTSSKDDPLADFLK